MGYENLNNSPLRFSFNIFFLSSSISKNTLYFKYYDVCNLDILDKTKFRHQKCPDKYNSAAVSISEFISAVLKKI
jgi:hypothetical protein